MSSTPSISSDPVAVPRSSVQAGPVERRASARVRPETLATSAVFIACAVLLGLTRLVIPGFGGAQQLATIVALASFLIVVAYGQGLVVLIGGLDLSMPSVLTLGGVLAAGWIGANGELSAWSYVAALGLCAGVGAINGIGVTWLRVPAFIMTLASGVVVYSLCLGATSGSPSGSAPPALRALMQGHVSAVPAAVLFALVFVALAWFCQSRTVFGRQLAALGANPRAAHIAGLRVSALTVGAYAACATCAGWAGMMLVGYSNGATLRMGDAYLLPSIAAVVIGGSSIFGGRGSYLGTVGGALLLTILSMIITSLGMPQGWRTLIEGGVILLALLLMQDRVLEAARRVLQRSRQR